VTCPACNSQFLAAFGTVACSNDDCPFCRLVQRFGTDQRLQRSFPTHAPSTDAAGMQVEMLALLCHGERGADGDSGPQ
jgi:hypothetical protein